MWEGPIERCREWLPELLMQESTPVAPVAAFRRPEELARLRPVIRKVLLLLRSRRRQRRLTKHELLLLRRGWCHAGGRLIAVVVVQLHRYRRAPRL